MYEDTPSCSSEIADALTDAIAEAAARKSAFDTADGYYNTLVEGVKALRDQRNDLQLGLHGIRKMMATLNNELDDLLKLEKLVGLTTITEIID